LEKLLEHVFSLGNDEPVIFEALSMANATKADVIVKNFVAGEAFICHPMLKFRVKPGLLIGLYEGNKSPWHTELPLCIKNILFINRNEMLSVVYDKIIEAWQEKIIDSKELKCKKCLKCRYRSLTSQQSVIARHILHGNDIIEIASSLEINVKTVSAHKRLMMKKFNLDSDCELVQFLNNLRTHNPPVHLFAS
jgi:DNA-binding CsgD family transcriptional regulator